MLAARPRAVLKALVSTNRPVKIKELADRFQVSPRTVKYDLESIRYFLRARDIQLHSQPRKGVWLDDVGSTKERLQDILSDDVQGGAVLARSERTRYVMMHLLLSERPMTLAALANLVGVSRNTVIEDVNAAERLLAKWKVRIERRARIGVTADATEADRRRAIESTVFELLSATEIYHIIQWLILSSNHQFPDKKLAKIFLLSEDVIRTIGAAISDLVRSAQTLGVFLTEREIISVFVRICILVCRSMSEAKEVLLFDAHLVSRVWKLPVYRLVRRLLNTLETATGVSFAENDVVYVCLPLVSDGLLFMEQQSSNALHDESVLMLTHRLIANVERRLGISLCDDTDLFDGLFSHMTSRLAKYSAGVPEPNPMTEDIIRQYNHMFGHVEAACKEVLAPAGFEFATSDIAYLVLHFAAACERLSARSNYRALVVCATGRGSARFIKHFFENEVRHLQVVGCCSATEVTEMVRSLQVDLVISALPLRWDIQVPVVTVNHLPTRSDVELVTAMLEQLRTGQTPIEGYPVKATRGALDGITSIRSMISPDTLHLCETLSHEVITKGFELSHSIVSKFRAHLTEDRILGLTLHVLLMVNRLAFNRLYSTDERSETMDDEWMRELRLQLKDLLHDHHIDVTDAEINAIIRYFTNMQVGGV
jgi:mannitol operon transcriptional antiterminator